MKSVCGSWALLASVRAMQLQVDPDGAVTSVDPGMGSEHDDHMEHLRDGCTVYRGAMSICRKSTDGQESCKEMKGQCLSKKTQTGWKDVFEPKDLGNCSVYHQGFEVCKLIDGKEEHKDMPPRCLRKTKSRQTGKGALEPPEEADGCAVWFDGCNTCRIYKDKMYCPRKRQCDEKLKAECKLKVGEKPQMREPDAKAPDEAKGCAIWFDGCNDCKVHNGGLYCSKRMCAERKEPVCKRSMTGCCKAKHAKCIACSKRVSVEQVCMKAPMLPGCPKQEKPGSPEKPKPELCCKAATAECMACDKGVSVEDLCKKAPKIPGCPEQTRPCCRAMNAKCMACAKGVSVEELCEKLPKTAGCPSVGDETNAGGTDDDIFEDDMGDTMDEDGMDDDVMD